MPSDCAASLTASPAGWCRSTVRRRVKRSGSSWSECLPPNANATTACRSSCSVTSAPPRWCRPASCATPTRSCSCSRIRQSSWRAPSPMRRCVIWSGWRRRCSRRSWTTRSALSIPGTRLATAAGSASARARWVTSSTNSSERTRCAPISPYPSAPSGRYSTTRGRSPPASVTPRGSSAPRFCPPRLRLRHREVSRSRF